MRGNKGSTDAFWVNNTALNKVYGASDIGIMLDDAGAEQVRGVCAWIAGSRFNLADALQLTGCQHSAHAAVRPEPPSSPLRSLPCCGGCCSKGAGARRVPLGCQSIASWGMASSRPSKRRVLVHHGCWGVNLHVTCDLATLFPLFLVPYSLSWTILTPNFQSRSFRLQVYSQNDFSDLAPEVLYSLAGDGTVPAASLAVCAGWVSAQTQAVRAHVYEGVSHSVILWDTRALRDVMWAVVAGIPAPHVAAAAA